ncbi:MAG: 2-phospho-L-lactate transferase [Nitrososphaerota archaeon]|nr:2-phospho-L-lactate transferase [Nitrososphaerota archaeon]MDG7046825.1 2-phospho-L-lactate transferase [Nitrososphaerota archaeon]MDG7047664.1 2-phospho-L-lactate transferase [Nitrososphaerota archaeon]
MNISMLAGGTAGSKLAVGSLATDDDVTVVANVGDDVEVLGLYVSPDLDTIIYSCAGLLDLDRGWGIKGDSFNAFDMWKSLGVQPWIMLGDRDISLHVYRSWKLKHGYTLTDIAQEVAALLGLKIHVLPATNDRLTTVISTDLGETSFEEYYIRYSRERDIRAVTYQGSDHARATPQVLSALKRTELLIIPPSNPLASVWPILSIDEIRRTILKRKFSVIAVSPFIGGHAVKGPAERMMKDIGLEASAMGLAKLYKGLVDILVIDAADSRLASPIRDMGFKVYIEDTLMNSKEGMEALYKRLKEVATSP